MFSESFYPKFADTDALGHINNTKIPVWFEGGRDPIFKFFNPNLDPQNWCLILAKIDITFHAQMHYGKEMEVKTYVSKIGNSSFNVYQELWQSNLKCASGTAVMVHFSFEEQKSQVIPDKIKTVLKQHLLENT